MQNLLGQTKQQVTGAVMLFSDKGDIKISKHHGPKSFTYPI